LVGKEKKQREGYFFFLPADLAFFLAGFFVAMAHGPKKPAQLHENTAALRK